MNLDLQEKPASRRSVEQVISSQSVDSSTPNLLLHVCCAPCACYVLEYLLPYFNTTLLFYNPNIRPYDEYTKRAAEVENRLMKFFAAEYNNHSEQRVELIISDYCGVDFETIALEYPDEPEGGMRCRECFKLRLDKTAQYACKGGYDYFATTLSVSPHKNAALINEVGLGLADMCGADKASPRFLCADFKKRGGYIRSAELAKQLGLYRQNYCGCRLG